MNFPGHWQVHRIMMLPWWWIKQYVAFHSGTATGSVVIIAGLRLKPPTGTRKWGEYPRRGVGGWYEGWGLNQITSGACKPKQHGRSVPCYNCDVLEPVPWLSIFLVASGERINVYLWGKVSTKKQTFPSNLYMACWGIHTETCTQRDHPTSIMDKNLLTNHRISTP